MNSSDEHVKPVAYPMGEWGSPHLTLLKYDPQDLSKNTRNLFKKGVFTYEPAWLKCEENEEARRLFFNPEEPRICIFRVREEPQ